MSRHEPLRMLLVPFALLIGATGFCATGEQTNAATQTLSPLQKVILTDVGAAAVIAGWGFVNWDYGQTDWHSQNEGWFGQSTKEGGADKAGHLYATYTLGRSLTGLFRHYGYDHDKSVFAGAASSFGIMTLMELADGYSPYGYSPEDETMNLAGAGAAWLLAANPSLDRKFALRGEYHVNRHAAQDVLTDYERWRYYLTVKLDGFEGMPEPLRWIELHAGYFVRGYDDADPANDERATFVGIGLSFSKLARSLGWQRTGTFFNYFQPPHTIAREDDVR